MQHKTQRIERLVIGVLGALTSSYLRPSPGSHLRAHGPPFICLRSSFWLSPLSSLTWLRRARLFPALLDELAFVKLAALDSGVAVDIGLPVSVCVYLLFGLVVMRSS